MAKSPNPDKLRDQFLSEYNLTVDDIRYKHIDWDTNEEKEICLFEGDPKYGDMRIYYPSLDGHLHRYNDNGKWGTTYRLRKALPLINKTTGKETKYLMSGNNCIFFPPAMITAFKNKTKIETLCVVEGEKKAFVACKNGFDIVGISGIWNFCTKTEKIDDKEQQGELMPELKEFIKTCGVTTVILVHDADALDMSSSDNKSATDRPFTFFQTVKRFAELIFQEGVKFYYSYINPYLGTKGLDDVIIKYPDVAFDFVESLLANKFTTYFCTQRIQFIKASSIKEIFHLNDPEDFYKYHKANLKQKTEFRFDNRLFKINHADDSIEEVKTTERAMVWENEGKYYGYDIRGNTKCFSNFTMNVLFLLKSSSNPKRIVSFKNVLGQECIKELTMDDFVSTSSFRKKLISDGSYIFKGEMLELLNLQELLFKEEQLAAEITSLGWQKTYGFYAWSNGLTSEGKFFPIDEFGVVQFGDRKFYLPAFSSLFNEGDIAFENERNFKHMVEHEIKFEEWATLFTTLYKANGHIGMCFYIASLFRDIIYGTNKEFPLIILFGQKGSGKSTMAKSMMSMFGLPQSAMSLENASSTKKGMYRKFAQFRNALVWLDEYKNSIHPDLIGMLKNLYDGIGYERAQTSQDHRTTNVPVLSSTILSGQDMPTADPALFSRGLLLMFKNNTFSEADRKAYNQLTAIEKKGLTCITIALLAHRNLVEEKFMTHYKMWCKKFEEHFKFKDILDRMYKSAAMVLSPISILFDENVFDKSALPFTINNLYAHFVDCLEQHRNLMNDNQEISVFWETVETLFDEGFITGNDFRFLDDCVAIRFNRVYSAYAEKYRKVHGRNGLDKITIINYLKNSAAFVEIKDSVRFESSVSSAYVFKTKEIGINLVKELHSPHEAPIVKSEHKIKEAAPLQTTISGDGDDLPF